MALRPLVQMVLDDMASGLSAAAVSRRFHDAVLEMVVELACTAREATGLETVALGGGCFMNRYLMTRLPGMLRARGFEVLTNKDLPPNDGCIAYGQAAVAAARLLSRR